MPESCSDRYFDARWDCAGRGGLCVLLLARSPSCKRGGHGSTEVLEGLPAGGDDEPRGGKSCGSAPEMLSPAVSCFRI